MLAATSLLEKEKNPTEEQIRDALSGVLCRCTGYLKPVQAVLRAAAILRGEQVEPLVITMTLSVQITGQDDLLSGEEIGPAGMALL